MNRLLFYLETNGILLCNQNPFLPALEDIGCGWKDVTELIDSHELFYSKVFKGRTTYLSVEAYLLLKAVREEKPLTSQAEYVFSLLDGNPPADIRFLKAAAAPVLSGKDFREAFDFLLRNLYITAVRNGRQLNENWSEFLYGTAKQWESLSPGFEEKKKGWENGQNREGEHKGAEEYTAGRLAEIMGGVVKEKDLKALIRG